MRWTALRLALLTSAFALGACAPGGGATDGARHELTGTPPGGETSATGAPPVTSFTPDVPAWRGGCFFSGPAGKIVNASPSADVRLFGAACAAAPGPGGLVYLDRYDPVTGTGDVTVLSSAPGSKPVLVGKNGGAAGTIDGSTGARFDDAGTKLLTLADVGYVTGRLVLVSLPDASSVQTVAPSGARVENYDFLPGDAVLYVGNYSASARAGDLVYWSAGAAQTVAAGASRFDFNMYRLAPDRRRVAYLTGWAAATGGDLYVQTLPPGAAPARIDAGVSQAGWTADSRYLVYLSAPPGAVGAALRAWDGAAARTLATDVQSASVLGNAVVYATGWNVLAQRADLHLADLAAGTDVLLGRGASTAFGAALPPGAPPALALATDPGGGAAPFDLRASRGGAAGAVLDTGVAPEAGLRVSPAGGFVAYAKGFAQPQSGGSANPQPGIARELKVAPTAGGAPFAVAADAEAAWLAWHPADRFVAGLAAFDPAAAAGTLTVRDTATGAQVYAAPRVGWRWFDFGADGASLALLRSWDDGLQRGQLVLAAPPAGGAGAWTDAAVDSDVTFYLPPRGGRVLYGVRGGGRDGLWLGGAGP